MRGRVEAAEDTAKAIIALIARIDEEIGLAQLPRMKKSRAKPVAATAVRARPSESAAEARA